MKQTLISLFIIVFCLHQFLLPSVYYLNSYGMIDLSVIEKSFGLVKSTELAELDIYDERMSWRMVDFFLKKEGNRLSIKLKYFSSFHQFASMLDAKWSF
jgi:hypothetical protein